MTALLARTLPADSHPALLDWFQRRGFQPPALRVLRRLRASDLETLADAVTGWGLGLYRDGLRDGRGDRL